MTIFNVKLSRFRSPDFVVIKWLAFFKATIEVLWLLLRHPSARSLRIAQLTLRVKPWYTMLSVPRLVNLYERVADVNAQNLPGDIVECGVWHGGSGAVMAAACLDANIRRQVWLFDSFQGLPRPGKNDGSMEQDFYFDGWCKGDTDKVREIFDRLKIPPDTLQIVPGWFDATLTANKPRISQIAVMHVDADFYDPVKLVLDTFFDRVVPGGFVVIDDYWLYPGCKKAVDEFMQKSQLAGVELHNVGSAAVYFQRPV
jgi:O-methyltransferase